jgi:predicted DNA binding CopG/RHH family protein
MGTLKVVRDFLPPPEGLVLKEEQVKVTISLSKKSVDFFKTVARQNHTSYQKMIRRVIDLYSTNYDNRA